MEWQILFLLVVAIISMFLSVALIVRLVATVRTKTEIVISREEVEDRVQQGGRRCLILWGINILGVMAFSVSSYLFGYGGPWHSRPGLATLAAFFLATSFLSPHSHGVWGKN